MSVTPVYPADYPNWFRNRFTALPFVRRVALRAKLVLKRDLDAYLRRVSQVVHVGAHFGEERFLYDAWNLRVTWIEANPGAMAQLRANLATFPRQRAFQALITDHDGDTQRFFVASHTGVASSIFSRKFHRDLFPHLDYEREIPLPTTTLPALLAGQGIALTPPAVLVLDIQGAELLALRGAQPILGKFDYIKTETTDLELYAGACLDHELDAFLRAAGFAAIARKKLTRHATGGGLSDVLYRRRC